MAMRPVTFRATPATAATPATPTGTTASAEAFRDAVAALVAAGTPRVAAVRATAATHPDLHQAFLDATSFEPAKATDPAKVIAAWNRSVSATQKLRGCTRHKACVLAARENPDLHALWLSATNPHTY